MSDVFAEPSRPKSAGTLSNDPRLSRLVGSLLKLSLLIAALWRADAAVATIVVGTTDVTSVVHAFGTPGGVMSEIADYLVNFDAVPGPPFTSNLDSDTSIAYTMSAPSGFKFAVHVPSGESAYMYSTLEWRTGNSDTLTAATNFGVNFSGLVGPAPSFPNNSAVGDANNVFQFQTFGSSGITGDLSFTSITLTTTYAARTSHGSLTYQPHNFFAIVYDHPGIIPDPGPFVSLVPVPEPSTFLLALSSGALVVGLTLWRRGGR